MRNIRLLMEYDGSRYHGWDGNHGRKQASSIRKKLENVLTRMEGAPVEVIGAVRTEPGVHAYGQVANFKTTSEKELWEIQRECNHYLPKDIAVLKAWDVPERFHSVFSAHSATYQYRVVTEEAEWAFQRNYAHLQKEALNYEAMRRAGEILQGEHDFMAFSDNPRMKKSTIRQVQDLSIQEKEGEVLLTIQCDDFWPGMAGNLAGILMEAGRGTIQLSQMEEILESRERQRAKFAVDAGGLYLLHVDYDGGTSFAESVK